MRFQPKDGVLFQRALSLRDAGTLKDCLSRDDLRLEASDSVALLSDRGELYELNLLAALTWEMVTEGCSVDEIAEVISRHFTVTSLRAMEDVAAVLGTLERHQLVSRVAQRE
ncbi:PqqD family protein [Cellulomonas carbonis]|uniref:PqqD family protein n=1 Tax=Cellulomonas carbonis TaxID=1386092 RepID=UPI00166B51EA|nr:PqqD family protein [Cellulomonas carbonis]GGC17839.1 hypothetical protein GCM10010972_33840 [Cellulomonas carbonis]